MPQPQPLPLAARQTGAVILPFPGPPDAGARRRDPVRAISDYWERLRAGRVAPARAELDLGAIARALPWCFLAQRIAPGNARLRLAGRRIAALTGLVEARGAALGALFAPRAQAGLDRALEALALGARAELALRLDPGCGQPPVAARMLLLPLADDMNRLAHVLGVVALNGAPPTRACRFDLAHGAPRPEAGAAPTPAPVLRLVTGGRHPDQPRPGTP